jgi:hypothetical protein
MATPIGSAPPPPGPGSPSRAPVGGPAQGGTPIMLPENWVGKVTDKIVTTVDTVRAKTTVPIEKVGRIVIWGLLIATAGISLLVVLLIGSLRLIYEAVGNVPGIRGREGRSVWIIDVLFGVVLIAAGLYLVKRGTRARPED